MTDAERDEYLLRTTDEEFARLGFQHRVWAAEAYDLWRRAGVAPGQTILNVGCGPGYDAVDLAHLVWPDGRVISVDISERFLARLRERVARGDAPANIETLRADAQEMDIAPGSVDCAWARWVLCFVRDPGAVVERVARSLKPGGAFVVQDYFNWGAFCLSRPCPEMDAVREAIRESWAQSGGDHMVGGKLPALMERAGLVVQSVRAIVKTVRPQEATWRWPETYWRSFLPTLVEERRLTGEQVDAFFRAWTAASVETGVFFQTPPMVGIVARKPR